MLLMSTIYIHIFVYFMIEKLQELGLTKNEATVYMALLILQSAGAGDIIKDTKLHRHIVYTALESLTSKKLIVRSGKAGLSKFRIIDPEIFETNALKQVDIAKLVMQEVRSYQTGKVEQDIVVYDTLEDIKNYELNHLLQLPNQSTISILGVLGEKWMQINGEEFFLRYIEVCRKKQIKNQWIGFFPTQQESDLSKKYSDVLEYRYITGPSLTVSSFEITPFAISLRNYSSNPSVIEIRNQELRGDYQKYFDEIWKHARGE